MFEYNHLNIAPWGVEIAVYFFIIGIAGMVFTVAAAPRVFGTVAAPFNDFQRVGSILALVLLAVCVPLLILDLGQPSRFLYPILYFRWTSPLSWGAVFLPLFGLAILGFLAGMMTGREALQRWSGIFGMLLALSMPLYTGLDLMVHQARALWANPTLPMLFVVLSVTSGAAVVAVVLLAMGRFTPEAAKLMRTVLACSLFVTFWLFLGLVLTMTFGTAELQQAWAAINAEWSMQFWGVTFVIGIVLPMAMVFGSMLFNQLAFLASPASITAAALLGAVGAYSLRKVIIYAGQMPQLFY